jgi:hypothetical protein
MIKNWILQNKMFFIGGMLGAAAGYLYWQFLGCDEGCTITSSPLNSTLYFMLFGAVIFGTFKKRQDGNKK